MRPARSSEWVPCRSQHPVVAERSMVFRFKDVNTAVDKLVAALVRKAHAMPHGCLADAVLAGPCCRKCCCLTRRPSERRVPIRIEETLEFTRAFTLSSVDTLTRCCWKLESTHALGLAGRTPLSQRHPHGAVALEARTKGDLPHAVPAVHATHLLEQPELVPWRGAQVNAPTHAQTIARCTHQIEEDDVLPYRCSTPFEAATSSGSKACGSGAR
jgi:hypothetical protein